ncbi:MAG TPA: PRC-barrel domain-containing protein [Stellaceae bacterium]|nr:PRC-barrel domain-containing protein [Stellaceae bacterium]
MSRRHLARALGALWGVALTLALLAGARAEPASSAAPTPAAPPQQSAPAAPAPAPAAQPATPAGNPPAAAAKPPAPAAANPPATPAKGPPPPPQNIETLQAGMAAGILGKKVRDAAGADMGAVVNVLVDRNGIPLAAVIDFGGFLGVGSRKIAIDWQLLQFNPTDQNAPILLALTRAEVQAAPEYKPDTQLVQIVGPPAAEGGTVAPARGK